MLKKIRCFDLLLILLFVALLAAGFAFVFHDSPEDEKLLARVESSSTVQKSEPVPAESLTGRAPAAASPGKIGTEAAGESGSEPALAATPVDIALDNAAHSFDYGIEGVVFSLATGLPLADCRIEFQGLTVNSGSHGEFTLWHGGGSGRLQFSLAGFKPLTVNRYDAAAGSGLVVCEVFLSPDSEPKNGRIELNGVNGRVYERGSGAPVGGARIVIAKNQTISDEAGFFELWGNDSGLTTMTIAAEGYVSEMISAIDFTNRNNPFFYEIALQRAEDETGQKGRRLALVGIGARLVKGENGYEIADVLDDSPAAREGLVAGDRLVAVDQLAVEEFSLKELVELIRGRADEPVSLVIERDGEIMEVICRRERVVY